MSPKNITKITSQNFFQFGPPPNQNFWLRQWSQPSFSGSLTPVWWIRTSPLFKTLHWYTESRCRNHWCRNRLHSIPPKMLQSLLWLSGVGFKIINMTNYVLFLWWKNSGYVINWSFFDNLFSHPSSCFAPLPVPPPTQRCWLDTSLNKILRGRAFLTEACVPYFGRF